MGKEGFYYTGSPRSSAHAHDSDGITVTTHQGRRDLGDWLYFWGCFWNLIRFRHGQMGRGIEQQNWN